MQIELINEIKEKANYCLNCKSKPCSQKGCPLGNNIPEFIKQIKEEDYNKAYKILSETTVLSGICGRICPHKKQCQGSCIRGIKSNPVSIGELEAFVFDKVLKDEDSLLKCYDKDIEKNKATKQSFIDGTRRWDFNEYDKEGGGERSRDDKGIEEKAKETLAGEAKKFELTKDGAVGGNGVLLAQKIDANSPDKQTFIDAEKKWEFNEHSKEGKGPSSRDDKGIKEAQKSTMVKKAVRGNYQSIADFLMS